MRPGDPIPLKQVPRVRSYQAMIVANFNKERRRNWMIWASAHQPCSVCKAGAREPCLNMLDIRKGIPREQARHNQNPHDARIDWVRLTTGLQKRGLL